MTSRRYSISDLLAPKAFEAVRRTYLRRYNVPLIAADANGRIVYGHPACPREPGEALCDRCRLRATQEALRWGEPCIDLCPRGFFLWAVPLMVNDQLIGGLVAVGVAVEPAAGSAGLPTRRIREAGQGLLAMAAQANLTNTALLQLRRMESGRERNKAEALHALKEHTYENVRNLYLREEPGLLAAIQRGERDPALKIVSRILAGLHQLGRHRMDLLKSVALELAVMMSRAAVETGGAPSGLLGPRFDAINRLDSLRNEEELGVWLTGLLDRVLDSLHENRRGSPHTVLLGKALRHMQAHLDRNLSRNEVARTAGLSPSHFSHLMTEKMGISFTNLLARYRIDKAAQLLRRTDKHLSDIALACGFTDQSYFTKVFRRLTGETPLLYRRHGFSSANAKR